MQTNRIKCDYRSENDIELCITRITRLCPRGQCSVPKEPLQKIVAKSLKQLKEQVADNTHFKFIFSPRGHGYSHSEEIVPAVSDSGIVSTSQD